MKQYIFGENNDLVLKKDINNMFIISVGLKKNIQIILHSFLSKDELLLLSNQDSENLVPTIYCNFVAHFHYENESYGSDSDNNRGVRISELAVDSIDINSLKLTITSDYIDQDLCIEKNLLEFDPSIITDFEIIIKELCENNTIDLN